MTGFEPAASCSQSKRSTKLSHIRKYSIIIICIYKAISALPVAVPGVLLADGAASSTTDRGHSLGSLDSATGGGRLAPQTEPHPGDFGYGSIIHTISQKSNQKNAAYNIMYKFEKNHNLLHKNSFKIVKNDKKGKKGIDRTIFRC